MKRIFTVSAIALISSMAFKTFAQSSFNTGGETAGTGSGSTISYSIGQVFDSFNPYPSTAVLEGVQQPSEISSPLPVTLIYFKASLTAENQVELSWSTASEFNNDFFTIERSGDPSKFKEWKTVPGLVNSNQVTFYQELDTDPISGTSYYRLKQTDRDGSYAYSKIVVIKLGHSAEQVITYPNPATDFVSIKMAKTNSKSNYKLFNLDGKFIQSGNMAENPTVLKISHLTAGTYLLKIEEDGYTQVLKIVKI